MSSTSAPPPAPALPGSRGGLPARKPKKIKKRKPGEGINESFFDEISENLLTFLNDKSKCDVQFIVGTGEDRKEFFSSKALLAAQSTMFQEKFYGESKVDAVAVLEYPEEAPWAFEVLFNFLHTGFLTMSEKELENLTKVITLAEKLKFMHLFSACYKLIANDINEKNVIDLLYIAEKHDERALYDTCFGFICKNGEALLSDKDFMKKLTPTILLKLLERDDLAANELTVFDTIIEWAKERLAATDEKIEVAEYLKDHMRLVRFPLIPAEKLVNYVFPTGMISEDTLIELLSYTVDKKTFGAAVTKKFNVKKRKRVASRSGSIPYELARTRVATVPGPAAGYSNTHDGGAAIVNGKLYAHYGNDSNGNRVHVIALDPEDGKYAPTRQIPLPFPTHGSYPASDREKYIYVFEDSDAAHGNGFGRIDAETDTFEALAPVSHAHCRYSSGAVQGGFFWKMGSGNAVLCYNIATNSWSTKITVHSNAIVMADPFDEDFVWFMFQGGRLERYSITTNTMTGVAARPGGFNLGANYSAIIMPRASETGDSEGVLIAAFASSDRWKLYDSVLNTWTDLGWPGIGEGGHVAYDPATRSVYIQANNTSAWVIVRYEEE